MQDLTLKLEEWRSLQLQIAKLSERKKLIESELESQYSTKEGSQSTIYNEGNFKITKTEKLSYSLSKKEYEALTQKEKDEIMSLGVVQPDVKMSEAKCRDLAKDHGALLSKCITEKPVSSVKIEFKPKGEK